MAFTEKILYGQGGNLYIGNRDTGFVLVDDSGVGGPAYLTDHEFSICAAGRYFWYVDGVTPLRRVNMDTEVLDEPAATGGTIPTDSRLLWLYRDRLFHGRLASQPYNYVASKSGDFLNYDAGDTTQTGAFAGNTTAQAGLLGDIQTAAIPYGDNSCVMGMANMIAVMRGDPKSGGNIDVISREIGMVGPRAWARDPDGNLYFMSRDGLYVMTPTTPPKPMSRGRMDQTLGTIDHTSTKIMMAWDPKEEGLKIYLMPLTAGDPTTVVYWEQRKNAFWIDSVGAGVGPTACVTVNSAARRTVVLGCWDGYLRELNEEALTDDGSLISSRIRYADNQILSSLLNAKITQMRFLWGTSTPFPHFNVTYKLFAGDDAVSVSLLDDPVYMKRIIREGYQELDRTRTRGGCFTLELSNDILDTAWQVEEINFLAAPSGRIRTGKDQGTAS
jgi:hypothetical protein